MTLHALPFLMGDRRCPECGNRPRFAEPLRAEGERLLIVGYTCPRGDRWVEREAGADAPGVE